MAQGQNRFINNNLQMSVFRFEVGESVRLVAASGHANFGGSEFTAQLVSHCLSKLIEQPSGVYRRKQLTKTIWNACEMAKAELSSSNETR